MWSSRIPPRIRFLYFPLQFIAPSFPELPRKQTWVSDSDFLSSYPSFSKPLSLTIFPLKYLLNLSLHFLSCSPVPQFCLSPSFSYIITWVQNGLAGWRHTVPQCLQVTLSQLLQSTLSQTQASLCIYPGNSFMLFFLSSH